MSAAHERWDELAAGYAVDALAGEDLREFRAHRESGCPACERALAEYREALAHAASDLREAPPAHVKARVLERVGRRPARVVPLLRFAASVALAAGIAAWVSTAYVRSVYEERIAAMAQTAAGLREQLAEQTRTLASLREELAAQERTLQMVRAESEAQARVLALLQDPATEVVTLAGLPAAPEGRARLLWTPGRGGVLLATGLPPTPPDKTYELWAIAGGKPVPAGLFTVDAQGRGSAQVPALEGVAAVDVFAVTLEPANGVPQPTGPMVLASKTA
jgi:anti-sigma-K factor RskA